MQEFDVPPTMKKDQEQNIKSAKRVKQEAKIYGLKIMQAKWEEKPMHGQYPSSIKKPDVEQEQTHQWLQSAGLKAETEGMMIAAQDQTPATRSYHHRIMKDGTDPKCRLCNY